MTSGARRMRRRAPRCALWSGAPSLTSPLTMERVPSAPLYSTYVDTDTFDSQRLDSVCALHSGGIEPGGQVLWTRGESMSPVAIVTASDSGIGQESAKELAENGFDVGITYRTDEAGAQETLEAVRAAGRRGEVRRLDLTELPGAADVIDDLADALGGMDVLVNNAGTGDPTGAFLELSYEEWRQVVDTNLSGAFLCAQRAARRMVDAGNGGRIINITSVHEHIPRTGASAYCASKGGLGLLTKVMAMELAEYGILVNAVGPGEISTPMTGAEDEDPTTIERPKLPLGRPGHAREIAAWVAFLASEKSSYATGASFVVDGGLTLMAAELSSYATRTSTHWTIANLVFARSAYHRAESAFAKDGVVGTPTCAAADVPSGIATDFRWAHASWDNARPDVSSIADPRSEVCGLECSALGTPVRVAPTNLRNA